MPEYKSMLCVGGPLAGKRYAIAAGSGFRVPVMDGPLPDSNSESYQPNAEVPYKFTDYRTESFHTPQGEVLFWVPREQSPLETITMLLEAYEHEAAH